jgi:hypothetical protein
MHFGLFELLSSTCSDDAVTTTCALITGNGINAVMDGMLTAGVRIGDCPDSSDPAGGDKE